METHDTREVEEWEREFDELFEWTDFDGNIGSYVLIKKKSSYALEETERAELKAFIHHQLQKAREEEREKIEAIFKEHVPPHAMDLEDSVWLKRLLNKAFNHNQNV